MREIKIKFVGIDDFSRPVFKDINTKTYFGSVNTLLPDKKVSPNNDIVEIHRYFRANIKELEYFGNSFNCEPHGGLNSNIKLVII